MDEHALPEPQVGGGKERGVGGTTCDRHGGGLFKRERARFFGDSSGARDVKLSVCAAPRVGQLDGVVDFITYTKPGHALPYCRDHPCHVETEHQRRLHHAAEHPAPHTHVGEVDRSRADLGEYLVDARLRNLDFLYL